jgi:hypothetical protein
MSDVLAAVTQLAVRIFSMAGWERRPHLRLIYQKDRR